jgi:hypothetical protein
LHLHLDPVAVQIHVEGETTMLTPVDGTAEGRLRFKSNRWLG